MIESWMVTLLISVVTIVSSFAVIKVKVKEGDERDIQHENRLKKLEQFMNENKPVLLHFNKIEDSFTHKIDEHGKAIVELYQKHIKLLQ